jgi:para-aminobenzoate synthetase/4-amino-4-deoxychorismate lyase
MSLRPEPDVQLLESILWNNGFFLLPEHLNRLKDSSRTLGFSTVQAESIEDALNDLEKTTLTKGKSFKVRLTVSRDGGCTVGAEEIMPRSKNVWNCALSPLPTDSRDKYLYHKTTNRALYDAELKKYRQSGFDEVLFCNEQGEVTEGSITNIIAKIHDTWVTPDVRCGLLAGVHRGYLLKRMNGRLRTACISLRELLEAERILLCNSVRGCIRVGALDANMRSPV